MNISEGLGTPRRSRKTFQGTASITVSTELDGTFLGQKIKSEAAVSPVVCSFRQKEQCWVVPVGGCGLEGDPRDINVIEGGQCPFEMAVSPCLHLDCGPPDFFFFLLN